MCYPCEFKSNMTELAPEDNIFNRLKMSTRETQCHRTTGHTASSSTTCPAGKTSVADKGAGREGQRRTKAGSQWTLTYSNEPQVDLSRKTTLNLLSVVILHNNTHIMVYQG